MEPEPAPEGEVPPLGTFQLQILGVTGAEKPLDGVRCSDSIGDVLQRLCAQSGADPLLTRLVFDQTVTRSTTGGARSRTTASCAPPSCT